MSGSSNVSGGFSSTPLTPTTLVSKFDNVATPQSGVTPSEFSNRVSKILHNVAPTIQLEDIDKEVSSFLENQHISNEDGLGNIATDEDLPDLTSTPTGSIWKARMMRNAFLTICQCASSHYLHETTTFAECKLVTQNSQQHVTDQHAIVPTSKKYSVKSVNNLTVKEFSGRYGVYKEWSESVELAFGQQGLSAFLEDENLCNIHEEVSYAAKCSLAQSLLQGTASYITNKNVDMKNSAKFYKLIKEKCDFQQDRDTHEFQQWMTLMGLNLEDRSECDTFLNDFETAVSNLKSDNSIAVTDTKLMRAILLRAIVCPDLEHFTTDMIQDSSASVEDISQKLRVKSVAFDAKDQFHKSSASTTMKSRRVNSGSANQDKLSHKPIKQNNIPPFPPGLRSAVPQSVWDKLVQWKALVNKPIKTSSEKKLLKEISFSADDASLNAPRSSRSAYKKGGKRKFSDDSVDNYARKKSRHSKDDYHGRSSRGNRYDDSRKRRSRRSRRDSTSESSDGGYDSSSSDSSHGRPRKSRRTHHSDHRRRSASRDRDGSLYARRGQPDISSDGGRRPSTNVKSVLFGGGGHRR